MISIRKEIDEIKNLDLTNILKNAPHSLTLLNEEWKYPYSIKKAFYPIESLVGKKKFPSVNRVDDIYGDKNILK